jgi:hypothetical protein
MIVIRFTIENKQLRCKAAEYLMGNLSIRPKWRGIIPIRSRFDSLSGSIRLNRFSAQPAAVSKTIVSLIQKLKVNRNEKPNIPFANS